jgi:hypothetical protein
LSDGTYAKLPWDIAKIEDHFAHISVQDGAMISYTPDAAKGELDIQVRTKPGRYLTKFYPHLSADDQGYPQARALRAPSIGAGRLWDTRPPKSERLLGGEEMG